ncbi:YggS family pyridoxal phosphate-dependent enzyme [Alistipes putredinis]|uniref:YggS family pyridoxal phosphate-dependent enzyme n=1 Tax=Alistipes putredinis TaxID=28117 RepID=UPI002592A3AA|nr:YggS family pyridoxal phosphate-dependent enzyme [uncultured Alistipes sp.]
MVDIKGNLAKVAATLPRDVELLAVTKFHPVEALREAYDCGLRRFGENRVQELLSKQPHLPSDIKWHFIGHLQSNKVRQIVGRVGMIESVDTVRLLNIIDRESQRAGVVTKVLLQLHVAREETKFGFSVDELMDFFENRGFESLSAVHICGLMGMASNTDDYERVSSDFREIARCYNLIRNDERFGLRGFDILSMGMTNDYEIAIREGSNHVRIGTAIFGEREY